ncbi:hypothetical protein CDG79_01180 [Nostoc sp. 'Peltigera membranacea cyanobiont' 232]|nr:hypothetical protein CDG79_01180 [Nostoc sp. 'Peltigera membranacea cyanobiont' 232]
MALYRLGVKTSLRGSSGVFVTQKRWFLFSFGELFVVHRWLEILGSNLKRNRLPGVATFRG